ncbi:MAG TPA: hypothetical protein VI916_07815 [Acidimicrobiia bacterium]|nr:hypothetical protein [Acidimicrobiia bacterium]
MLEWIAFAVGVALVFATFASIFDALVVPRGTPARFALRISRVVGASVRFVARRFSSYEDRDRILVLHGPASLIAVLVAWLTLLLVAFALVFWHLAPGGLGDAFRQSGSSLFTLGFATADEAGPVAATFIAAASGMVVVALQIAYLPTIYAAFNRRETLVTLLESRAGVPAWGPELLWRHHRVGISDSLPDLYSQWEIWSADVAETHTTYPVLAWFRSPHPYRSWVTALLAVLDAASMHLALCPSSAPSEARLCLRMGFTAVRDMSRVLNLPYDPDPLPDAPIDLTFEQFEEAVAVLREIGFPMERTAAEAWADFRGWRVNYEEAMCALANLVVAPPALWSGTRRDVREPAMPVRRPLDRTPEEPEGTASTKPTSWGA